MINTKEMTEEYRMSQWAEIMRRRVESGLNIRTYCQREGLKPDRYHYWQRKLRETAAKEMITAGAVTQSSVVPTGWVQVSEAETSKSPENVGVIIEIGKCRVTVNDTVDMELLTKVCKALVTLC